MTDRIESDIYRIALARTLYDFLSEDLIGRLVPTQRHMAEVMKGHCEHAIDWLERHTGNPQAALRGKWAKSGSYPALAEARIRLEQDATTLLTAPTHGRPQGAVDRGAAGAAFAKARRLATGSGQDVVSVLDDLLKMAKAQPIPLSGSLRSCRPSAPGAQPEAPSARATPTAPAAAAASSPLIDWDSVLAPPDAEQARWALASIIAWSVRGYRDRRDAPTLEMEKRWAAIPDERVGIALARFSPAGRPHEAESANSGAGLSEILAANALAYAIEQGVEWTAMLEDIFMRANDRYFGPDAKASREWWDRLRNHRAGVIAALSEMEPVLSVAAILDPEAIVRTNDRWLSSIIKSNKICGPALVSGILDNEDREGEIVGTVNQRMLAAAAANDSVTDEALSGMLLDLLKGLWHGGVGSAISALAYGSAAERIAALPPNLRLQKEVERLAARTDSEGLKALVGLPGAEHSEKVRKRVKAVRNKARLRDLARQARPGLFAALLERATSLPDAAEDRGIILMIGNATQEQLAAVSRKTWQALLSHYSGDIRLTAQLALVESRDACPAGEEIPVPPQSDGVRSRVIA